MRNSGGTMRGLTEIRHAEILHRQQTKCSADPRSLFWSFSSRTALELARKRYLGLEMPQVSFCILPYGRATLGKARRAGCTVPTALPFCLGRPVCVSAADGMGLRRFRREHLSRHEPASSGHLSVLRMRQARLFRQRMLWLHMQNAHIGFRPVKSPGQSAAAKDSLFGIDDCVTTAGEAKTCPSPASAGDDKWSC